MCINNARRPVQADSYQVFDPGTYPGNHQGVISTPKHKIFGKMTPSCILQDFLYLFESKEIFQKFHS